MAVLTEEEEEIVKWLTHVTAWLQVSDYDFADSSEQKKQFMHQSHLTKLQLLWLYVW